MVGPVTVQDEHRDQPWQAAPARTDRRRAANLAGICLIALIVSALLTPPVLQALADIRLVAVDGGSMSPTYHAGDVLIVRPPTPTDLREGSVVVVGTPPTSYTHRVVDIESRDGVPWAQLRGDANTTADPSWVTLPDVTAVPITAVSGGAAMAIRAATSLPGTLSLVALGVALAVLSFRPRPRPS